MLTAPLGRTVEHRAAPDFSALRTREFARLDRDDHAYLDYTGGALYPESLVVSHSRMLCDVVLGNPHSENPASRASSELIANARRRVLEFLDADPAEYAVCFTGNATGALGLVGSGYRFGREAPLVLSADNHNSVNGIREYASRSGAAVHYLPLDDHLRLRDPEFHLDALRQSTPVGLFALPAQSNFSGVKHPLSLVRVAQALGFRVLLDAAALLPMTRLSLTDIPADFVALSFYKMFGYPTGIGALVARRDALAELRRPWFSGGTVEFVSVQNNAHSMRDGEDGFEDGTANFLGIAAIPAGLDYLDGLGLPNLERHACALARELADTLASLAQRNGSPLVALYGADAETSRGATVVFNVLEASGRSVPFAAVESRARAKQVSVRGGCFCNPGASEAAFRFPAHETGQCLSRTRNGGFTLERFAECMRDYPVGAVRASFGAPSNRRDLIRLVEVVESFAS